MSKIDLSVAIPVYNNASTLQELLDRLIAVLDPMGISFELILVDDGSTDASWSILQERAARDPRIRPFAMVRNFGSQAAICAAFDQVRGERAICMDADLENCPEDIPALLEPLNHGYDLVCGYRESRSAPWLSRRLPSRLMNAYVRRKTGSAIRDVGCGMRGFQSWVIRDLAAEGEARRLMTPLFLKRARRVAEVPVRTGDKSRAGGHSFLSLLGIAADYYLLTVRRPFLLSGLAALVALGVSIPLLLAGVYAAGSLLLASGALGAMLSLIGEYCQRLYQLAQGLPFYQLRDLDAEAQRAMAPQHEPVRPEAQLRLAPPLATRAPGVEAMR
ncbi:MAG TPA: glycosyltransferase family 2 protein [Terriglobales bacterium]|nr:glycosyltransferase family 2 protein [Terriglobales bacterium]